MFLLLLVKKLRPHPLPFFDHLSFSDKDFLDWARPPPPSPFMKKNGQNWSKIGPKKVKILIFF